MDIIAGGKEDFDETTADFQDGTLTDVEAVDNSLKLVDSGTSGTDIESFESGWGNWNDYVYSWYIHSGGTSTGSTGPSSAYDGDHYVCREIEDYDGGVTETLGYDIGQTASGTISFYYHMYGEDHGTLTLQADNGSWIDLWTVSGDQGDHWNFVSKDFEGCSGFRFMYETADGYKGDLGLDKITVDYASYDYKTSGSRITELDTSNVVTTTGHYIEWLADVPTDTSLTIESSVDGKSTWQTCTNGDPIPNYTESVDKIYVKQTFSTSDSSKSPSLIKLGVYAPASRISSITIDDTTVQEVTIDGTTAWKYTTARRSPGPSVPIATSHGGDMAFYGEVPPSEFPNLDNGNAFNGSNLMDYFGLTAGTEQPYAASEPFLKFKYTIQPDDENYGVFGRNERILFIPKRTLRYDVSWEDIYNAGLVYGGYYPNTQIDVADEIVSGRDTRVNFNDGSQARIRLPRSLIFNGDDKSERDINYNGTYNHMDEWDALLFSTHQMAVDCEGTDWSEYDVSVDCSILEQLNHGLGSGTNKQYSDADLGGSLDNGGYSWMMEFEWYYYDGTWSSGWEKRERKMRHSNFTDKNSLEPEHRHSSHGYRPVLDWVE